MIKEACVENYLEAISAQKNGANRIELCENLIVGGTTPSFGTIKHCKLNLDIPVFVIIRPRGGNFVYSSEELEIMKSDIEICKSLNVDGIVLGILTDDNCVNIEQTKELINLAKPLPVTFHKAFDESNDPLQALEDIIDCGAARILTSGTKPTAKEGVGILNKIIKKAEERIKIVAAGKVTSENLQQLLTEIHTDEFHGRKIV